jgi:hypothetical protein
MMTLEVIINLIENIRIMKNKTKIIFKNYNP